MSQLDNVSVIKKVNSYFDGNVTSRSIILANGEQCSLGVMLPGEYEFSTADKEIMDIQSGKLQVLLADSEEWIDIEGEYSFEVPANSSFKLNVEQLTDYCCSYIK
ncbi:pyrimidine/purine nucleoside phosphorylase [Thalassomonas sp. M1454]|uniref:pyrimidine/purine nucleoside phosphorylase n=1 Tax=Thalassomonas sp. M1454 TaxID=2594477 RepID=UPI00117F9E6C|nr:pyrimidine/purine nucleoside phosphorylase [Thalassomonas sp. M1454]TRX56855.1 pyrimidine/purine nucleoside phosphorylase [Thalassomonas sp. M1454]